MVVTINVTGQKMIVAEYNRTLAPESQKFVQLKFNLSTDWDGLTVFAQFKQGENAYNEYLDANDCAYLPHEVTAGLCTLMLYGTGGDNVIGTTVCVVLTVSENGFVSNASSTEITQSLYDQMVALVKASTGSPLVASTAAAMLDHNKIYVYTGSETGYTYGNWYYYDGTAWQSGGAYNSAAVNTDTTLTLSGVPADAKATGDAIAAEATAREAADSDLRSALATRLALSYSSTTTIPNETDYDTIQDVGNYRCASQKSAGSMTNCASVSAHRLFVLSTFATNRLIQIIVDSTIYSHVWIRYFNGSDWGDWHKIAWEAQIPAIDSTLSIDGDAADAKVTGDSISALDKTLTATENAIAAAAEQVFTNAKTYTTPVNLNYGGVGVSSGGNYQNAGYCRSDFLPISGPVLIVAENIPEYRITGWFYSNATSSSGTHSVTNMKYYPSAIPLILDPEAEDKYFRFGFYRVDGETLTTDVTDPTSDYSIIRAAVKIYTKLGDGEYITDNGLGNIGKFATMEMFDRWAVCGASRDAGYIYPTAGGSGTTRRNLSWGKMAAKRAGNDCGCYAIAGATAASWINAASYGLNAMLEDDARQLYVVSFGYNEAAAGSSIGTAANMHDDISSYTSADLATMYGAYSYIILNIKQHAPNALIIGLFRYRDTMSAAYLDAWNCVNGVADKYGYPVINWCDSPIHNAYLMDTDGYKYGAHPTATGYSMMASVWDDLFSRCVYDNWEYFSHFLG